MGIGKVFIRRALLLCEFFSHKRMATKKKKKKKKTGGCLVFSALTICMEISVKNFCQMVLVFFFCVPKESIEMYHLQNTGTFFPGSSNPNIYGTKKR